MALPLDRSIHSGSFWNEKGCVCFFSHLLEPEDGKNSNMRTGGSSAFAERAWRRSYGGTAFKERSLWLAQP